MPSTPKSKAEKPSGGPISSKEIRGRERAQKKRLVFVPHDNRPKLDRADNAPIQFSNKGKVR